MLRLDSTLRKLEILLGGAVATAQPSFVASWSNATSTSYAGGFTPGVTNNTTAVTLVAAPAASTVRDVDYVSVRNLDSVSATVTIRYNDNGTTYAIITTDLAVGSQLVYTHGSGWQVVESDGSIKTGVTGPTGPTGSQGIMGVNAQAMLLDPPDEQDEATTSYSGASPNVNTGVQVFTGPIDITSSSGGQIRFPSAQNPSTGVNVLDDYEEGTWTPTLAFGGASVGITYDTRQGSYVKVGKIVTLWAYIKLTNKGSSPGTATITGVPFTSDSDSTFYGGGLPFFGSTTLIVSAGCAVPASSTSISLYNLPSSVIQDTNITNTTELVIGLTYKSAA